MGLTEPAISTAGWEAADWQLLAEWVQADKLEQDWHKRLRGATGVQASRGSGVSRSQVLWRQVSSPEAADRLSNKFSAWFSRFLCTTAGITEELKSPYSLRPPFGIGFRSLAPPLGKRNNCWVMC